MNRKQRRAQPKTVANPRVKSEPDVAALFATALARHLAGRLDEAVAAYDATLRCKPDMPEAHYNRAAALNALGRSNDAIAAYDVAIRLAPNYAKAHNNRGLILRDLGFPEEAIAAYDAALRIKPDYAEVHANRGNALKDLGRLDEAMAAFDTAIHISPDLAEAHTSRGNALRDLGRLDDAIAAHDAAIRARPDYAEAHNNRAVALKDLGRLDEAIAAFDAALRIRPDYAEAHSNRGAVLSDLGWGEQALAEFDAALRLKPRFLEARSCRILTLHYSQEKSEGAILSAARDYGSLVDRRLAPLSYANRRDPERPLRVGYVSGDFGRHPVGYFLVSALARHCQTAVKAFCYSACQRNDDLTAKLKTLAQQWRSLVGLTDKAAAALVRADAIDILVDLSGHTAGNRLPLFALKPAPVQVTWLGYFGTTGLAAIDYILADRFVVPHGEEANYVERVWRLPDSYLCFSRPDPDVPLAPLTEDSRPVLFGSFNKLAKISPRTIALWSKLLARLPDSRLLMKTAALGSDAARRRLIAEFAEHGVEPQRLRLEGAAPRAELLAAYNRIDVALDPTPYGGGTTTAEALWMGAPVVTLRGGAWVGRVSESILAAVGLPELVGANEEEYLDIALGLAAGAERRASLRRGLRAMVEASPLCDAERFTRNLEAAYRAMWREWCGGNTGQASA